MLEVYVLCPGDYIFVLKFQFYLEILDCSTLKIYGKVKNVKNTLIRSLLYVSKFLKRLILFGNKSLQGLF